MSERVIIEKEIGVLLEELYELGKKAGMEEERIENKEVEAKSYDEGVEEGYKQAKDEFHVPDL